MINYFNLLPYNGLSAGLLYDVLRLRADIFVVEQNSIYLDPDGYDQQALHLCGFNGEVLCAYARLIPPGVKFPEASIGRVCLRREARGNGQGRALMQRAIEETHGAYHAPILIEAQQYLLSFYQSLGFELISDMYILDGIAHVRMLHEKSPLIAQGASSEALA